MKRVILTLSIVLLVLPQLWAQSAQRANVSQAGAVVSGSGVMMPLTTTYGTPSSSTTFNVSGKKLTADVTVTSPTGFEVSTDNILFTNSLALDHEAANAQLSYINLNPDVFRMTVNGTSDYNYTCSVDNSVKTIQVTPIAVALHATIKVNGTALNSGATSSPINLVVGANKITIVVTAPNGITTKSYAVVVTRTPAVDASLINLTLSQGVLSPSFNANITNYTTTVNTTVNQIQLTPSASNSGATVKVNGIAAASGSASANIKLNNTTTDITIVVTAEDGITVKMYNLSVVRTASQNAGLSQILLTPATPLISNSVDGTSYLATVAQSVNSVQLTIIKSEANATIRINNIVTASGTPSAPIQLNAIGSTTITATITAQDGITIKNYKVTISKTAQNTTSITQLNITPNSTITRANNSPNFVTSVAPAVSSVQEIISTTDPNATIKINGVTVLSGKYTSPIPLNPTGQTVLTAVITAADKITTQTYTLIVSKNGASNPGLSQISLTPSSVITQQSSSTDYVTSVSPLINTVQQSITPIDATATIKVNGITVSAGALSAPITLNAGTTVITTVITAQDGTTSRTYLLYVNKNGSTNTSLANLALKPGATFSPLTNGDTYTASVDAATTSVQLAATLSDENATLKTNSVTVKSGLLSQPVSLNATSATTINVSVIAEDGVTAKNYKVTISKNGSTNTGLSQLLLNPTSTIAPITGTNNYVTSVSPLVTSVQQTAIADDSKATITVNGVAVTYGNASKPIPLNSTGPTIITTVVTSPDKSAKKTYTLTINKNGSSNTDLSQIFLTPASALILLPGTTDYTVSISPDVSSIQQTIVPADPGSSITVNGVPVLSNQSSMPIALNTTGNTVITSVITAKDGISTKTYTVTITRGSNSELLSPPTSDITALPIYLRLASAIPGGVYSGKITLNSNGADEATVATPVCKVNGAPLTITIDNVIKTYGALLNNQLGSSGFSVSGLKYAEKATSLLLTYGPGAAKEAATGSYVGSASATSPITGINGFLEGNYQIIYIKGNISVSPAQLTITAKKSSKYYGATLVNQAASAAFAITGGSLQNGNVINTVNITYGTAAVASASVGKYTGTILPSQAAGSNGFLTENYRITYAAGDLEILPVTVTIAVDNASRDFDKDDPTFTAKYNGFVNGETQSVLIRQPVIVTNAIRRSPIGQYSITASGAMALNYVFNYTPGVLAVNPGHIVLGIPNVITPNGDGINDTWNIKNLDAYPNAKVDVLDRSGQKLFSSKGGYGMAWDGTVNGRALPPGTYYYIIDPKNNAAVKSGTVSIIR